MSIFYLFCNSMQNMEMYGTNSVFSFLVHYLIQTLERIRSFKINYSIFGSFLTILEICKFTGFFMSKFKVPIILTRYIRM